MVLGPVKYKGKETRKVSLTKGIERTFWISDLMELKSVRISNPIRTCNLPSLECFEGSGNPLF